MVGVLKEDFVAKDMKQQRANLCAFVVWLGKDKIQYWHEGKAPTEEPVDEHPTLPINLHEVWMIDVSMCVCVMSEMSFGKSFVCLFVCLLVS